MINFFSLIFDYRTGKAGYQNGYLSSAAGIFIDIDLDIHYFEF